MVIEGDGCNVNIRADAFTAYPALFQCTFLICTLGDTVPSCLLHERATDVLNTAPLLYAEDSGDRLNLMAADLCQAGMFPAPTCHNCQSSTWARERNLMVSLNRA